MEKFRVHTGLAAILDRSDVDTDQIIPKQFLKKIERSGFGKHLFHDWRFQDDDGQIENPDFILNQSNYRNSTILVARDNFGCGSSREHAPWALLDYGFRVIIAPSFADIFYNNCFKNGILPISLSSDKVQKVFDYVDSNAPAELTVDLEHQKVRLGDSDEIDFEVDAFRKECLLNGWDDIGLTMRHQDKIAEFEKERTAQYGFYFSGLSR